MKFYGLDLPEFDPEEHIYLHKPQLKEVGDLDQESILRRIQTVADPHVSLAERLRIAAEEFDKVRHYCGAKVVEHEFGLYPVLDRPHIAPYHDPSLMPEGRILAARVALVKDVRPKHLPFHVRFGIFRYRNHNGMLIDLKNEQFIFGQAREDGELQDHDWVMVDIEPRLRRHSDAHSRNHMRA